MKTQQCAEVMSMILLAIIESTPAGGITIEELRAVYEAVTGNIPHYRTIKRHIDRLNIAIDPHVPAIVHTGEYHKRFYLRPGGYIYAYIAPSRRGIY